MRHFRLTGALLLGGVFLLAAVLAEARLEPVVPDMPVAGEVWREPNTGIEFLYVAGGEFEQGCGAWTSGCQDDEKPARHVRLSAFWIARTEVTQGQWKAVMEGNPSYFQLGDDHPVEQISWAAAKEFVRRLNAMSGRNVFRLPHEAEWEYACRGGGQPVAFGTQTGKLSSDLANYTLGKPVPVGRYPANALGLHDMSGNVAEWTEDTYDRAVYASGAAIDPVRRGPGSERVLRGGGWDNDTRTVRCAFRNGYAAGVRYGGPALSIHATGFRVAMSP